MKKALVIFVLLAVPATACADVCIKQTSHTDGYYFGGISTPAEDEEAEIWTCSDKMAILSEGRSVIMDAADSLIHFVNHDDSTFVEIAMPMDWTQVVDEQLLGRLNMLKRQGEVKATGETKKIGEWECNGYDVVTYIPYKGIRYEERETTAWAATDVPVDLEAYKDMVAELWTLRNYSDELKEEMRKIEGVEIASEGTLYMEGFGVDISEKVTEMSETEAPQGVYSVPRGYSEKEHLTRRDLR